MKYFISLVAVFLLTSHAYSHHSDAALEMDTIVSFEGAVTEFSFRNPHAYFTVKSTQADGGEVSWTVQMASSITMRRLGWTRDTLEIDDQVSVEVHPARDGRSYGLLESIVMENGDTLVSRPGRGVQSTQIAQASTVEGRWIVDRTRLPTDYPGGLDQLMIRELALTEKGSIAEAAFSQASGENPELSCISKPTPAMIIYTDLYPMEITVNNDETITLRSQYFDQERTVYMDGRGHPDIRELSHEGHSIGMWEDDELVIDTTNFNYHRSPYQNGIPSGPQKHVVERYQLLDNGSHMKVEFFLEDPEYIVGSMTYGRELRYVPLSDMSPFNCDLESTRRFLPN